MSDNSKEIGFYESIKEEAIQKNDAEKLAFAESKLADLRSGVSAITSASIAFPHASIFDFDEFADTGSSFLNGMVDKMLTDQYLEIHARYGEQIEQLTGKVKSLEIENEALTSTNIINDGRLKQVTEEKNLYKAERDDYEQRFIAAAEELRITKDEQLVDKAEIERLKQHEDDLQQQLANAPAPTARPVIDLNPATMDIDEFVQQAKKYKQEKAQREEEERKAALIKVTNIRWEDPNNRTFYNAELVLDGVDGKAGDTTRFHYFKKGQYLEVTADDAIRFRAEAAEQSATTAVESIPLVEPVAIVEVPEIDFRPTGDSNPETAVPQLSEPSDIGGAAEEITWEAIEARLYTFKQEVIKEITGEVA